MRNVNRTSVRIGAATVAAGVLAAGAFTLVSSGGAHAQGAAATTAKTASAVSYSFRTAGDSADPTFNQLLGINNEGLIAGYFGSGAPGHPNQGYQRSGASFQPENFPGSVQTQVTGLNNDGVTVGFWSSSNNGPGKDANYGFVNTGGSFRSADFPASSPGTEVSPTGTSYGTPQGWATVAYNPQAKTITVTLTASGLTPGAHAAHIHVGSCASQGPVQYMPMDFTANSHGQVVNQVRTVTGVTAPVPATGWYLNLHQGNSSNIVANGQPTVNFRPLLCADL